MANKAIDRAYLKDALQSYNERLDDAVVGAATTDIKGADDATAGTKKGIQTLTVVDNSNVAVPAADREKLLTIVPALNELDRKQGDADLTVIDTIASETVAKTNVSDAINVLDKELGENNAINTDIHSKDTVVDAINSVYTQSAVTIVEQIPEPTDPEYATIFKSYVVKQDSTAGGAAKIIGTIQIPKDKVVQKVEKIIATGEEKDPATGEYLEKGKPYLKLTIANQTDPVYIDIRDLENDYTVEEDAEKIQLAISGTRELSADVVAHSLGHDDLTEDTDKELDFIGFDHDKDKGSPEHYTKCKSTVTGALAVVNSDTPGPGQVSLTTVQTVNAAAGWTEEIIAGDTVLHVDEIPAGDPQLDTIAQNLREAVNELAFEGISTFKMGAYAEWEALTEDEKPINSVYLCTDSFIRWDGIAGHHNVAYNKNTLIFKVLDEKDGTKEPIEVFVDAGVHSDVVYVMTASDLTWNDITKTYTSYTPNEDADGNRVNYDAWGTIYFICTQYNDYVANTHTELGFYRKTSIDNSGEIERYIDFYQPLRNIWAKNDADNPIEVKYDKQPTGLPHNTFQISATIKEHAITNDYLANDINKELAFIGYDHDNLPYYEKSDATTTGALKVVDGTPGTNEVSLTEVTTVNAAAGKTETIVAGDYVVYKSAELDTEAQNLREAVNELVGDNEYHVKMYEIGTYQNLVDNIADMPINSLYMVTDDEFEYVDHAGNTKVGNKGSIFFKLQSETMTGYNLIVNPNNDLHKVVYLKDLARVTRNDEKALKYVDKDANTDPKGTYYVITLVHTGAPSDTDPVYAGIWMKKDAGTSGEIECVADFSNAIGGRLKFQDQTDHEVMLNINNVDWGNRMGTWVDAWIKNSSIDHKHFVDPINKELRIIGYNYGLTENIPEHYEICAKSAAGALEVIADGTITEGKVQISDVCKTNSDAGWDEYIEIGKYVKKVQVLGQAQLTTTAQSLVGGVNELDAKIGDVTTLTTTAKDSLVEAVNEVNDKPFMIWNGTIPATGKTTFSDIEPFVSQGCKRNYVYDVEVLGDVPAEIAGITYNNGDWVICYEETGPAEEPKFKKLGSANSGSNDAGSFIIFS